MKKKALVAGLLVTVVLFISQFTITFAEEPVAKKYWQYYTCTCPDGNPGHYYNCEVDGNTLDKCKNGSKPCQNNQTSLFCETPY